ncbi:hypothetical protein [Streptomyces sp. NPDC051994]|uniref:hypothetical protein n=1 Tax=unclassified Streptomyces TaxID=2593676 RepID=UPI00341C9BBD
MTTARRWFNALLHRGPGYDTTPLPRRGDAFDHWLRDQREQADPIAWCTIAELLDRYRLHADTRTPLTEHVCEGRVAGGCHCLEQADRRAS